MGGFFLGSNVVKPTRLWPIAAIMAALALFPILKKDETQIAPGECRRIVSLSPSVTRMLISLGVQHKLVGTTAFCPKVEGSQNIGNITSPNIERIVSLNPDIIICCEEDSPTLKIEQLQSANIALLVLRTNSTFNDIINNFRILANAVDQNERAKKLIKEYEDKRKSITKPAQKTALLLLAASPFITVSTSSFISKALSDGGYQNAIRSKNPYPLMAAEYLSIIKYDHVFISTMGDIEKVRKALMLPANFPVTELDSETACYYTPEDYLKTAEAIGSIKN